MADSTTPNVEDSPTVRTFQLGYGLWKCDHCGTEFVAMKGCGDCGKDGPQVDEDVDRRRAIAERVRPELDAASSADPLDLLKVWDPLSGWIEKLYDGLELIGQKDAGGEEAVAKSLLLLSGLRASAAASPRRRPLINLHRQLDAILEGLDGLARANLDALEAPSPDHAQAHEARAQTLLDGVADRAAECSRLVERLGLKVEGSFFQAMAKDTEAAFTFAGADGLVDLEARGAQIYESITGGLACPVGLGFSLMLTESKVRDVFDAERFHHDVRRAFEAFIERPLQLDALIQDADWQAAVRRAGRELFSAAVEAFDQASGSIEHKWFETRAMLRLSLLMTEGVAPIYLATLLALRRKDDWRRYQHWDPGQLLKEVEDAKLGELVVGLDVGVRDADAHRAYQQLEDGIALTSRARVGDREISAEELLDLTLAALESCVVLQTALMCAMTARGVAPEDLDAASDLVPKLEQMRIVASAAGLRKVVVETSDGAVRVTAHGSMEPPRVISTAAALAAAQPDYAGRLEYEVTDEHGAVWQAAGPLEPFGRMRAAEEAIVKECTAIEISAVWRVRGEPVMTQGYIRHWAAIRLGKSLGDLRETLDCVDAIAALARATGDSRLEKTVEAFGRLARARQARLQPPKKDQWASEQIVRWLNDKPTPPSGMAPA